MTNENKPPHNFQVRIKGQKAVALVLYELWCKRNCRAKNDPDLKKIGYACDEENGWLIFSEDGLGWNTTLSESVGFGDKITWEEAFDRLSVPQSKTIQLTPDYSATVTRNIHAVKVGCQEIPVEKILEVYQAIKDFGLDKP